MTLTGVIDTDLLVLSYLNDKDLLSICSTNQYMNTLCDEIFWNKRLKAKYNSHIECDAKSTYMHLNKLDDLGIARYAVVNMHNDLLKNFLPTVEYYVVVNVIELAIQLNNTDSLYVIMTHPEYVCIVVDEVIKCDNLNLFIHFDSFIGISDSYNLEIAICSDSVKIATYLINKGIKHRNDVYSINKDIILVLLQKGSLVVTRDYMIYAVLSNNYEIIELLLGNGGHVFATDCLLYVSKVSVAELLLRYGARMTNNTLIHAIVTGNVSLVKFLLQCGVTLNVEYHNPLESAVRNGNISIIKLLLKSGASVHYNDYKVFRIAGSNTDILNLLDKWS